MRYVLIFTDSDRHDEEIELTDPKVGDVLKLPDPQEQQLEYFTIMRVDGCTIKLGG